MSNVLKAKLKEGKRLVGTHVNLTDPCVCDIFGRLGFDFIWIDCEHNYLSMENVLVHLTAAAKNGVPAIVRVPRDDYNFTKKVLEMGPDGIIFPMVTSAEEVTRVLKYTLYPPEGIRGYGPMRAIGYGYEDALTYVNDKSHDMCRIIQIEDVRAVEDLPEILKNPWLDACIFGPNDLSGSMGHCGCGMSDETQDLIRKAANMLKAAQMPFGVSLGQTDMETLTHYAKMGMQILSVGADFGYLLDGAKEAYAHARQSFEAANK